MLPCPILLTCQQLLRPVIVAQTKLSEIRAQSPSDHGANLFREGLFVLAVSTVEYMLVDVLAALLRKIPSKLTEKSFAISRDTFLDPESDLLEDQIQRYLMELSYKRLDEFIDAFCGRLSINLAGYRAEYGELLQELKESRNLLLHNDLRVNAIYLAKAGKKARAKRIDEKLEIDPLYFASSLLVLDKLCSACQMEILAKYSSYTKAKAIRELWNYIFQTPVLKFDDYWEEDVVEDSVRLKVADFGVRMSGAEEMFLGIWLSHYNGSGCRHLQDFSMLRLDESNQSKMLWLLKVFKEFRVY